jgi:hypothetical protein
MKFLTLIDRISANAIHADSNVTASRGIASNNKEPFIDNESSPRIGP